MLLLFALIVRAVSLEFYGKVNNSSWRVLWGMAFGLGSLIPAVLYGVAVGNVLRGVPIDAEGVLYVPFLSLLNPFALLCGVLSLVLIVMQGAAYMTVKTEGDLQKRMEWWVDNAWDRVCFALRGRDGLSLFCFSISF